MSDSEMPVPAAEAEGEMQVEMEVKTESPTHGPGMAEEVEVKVQTEPPPYEPDMDGYDVKVKSEPTTHEPDLDEGVDVKVEREPTTHEPDMDEGVDVKVEREPTTYDEPDVDEPDLDEGVDVKVEREPTTHGPEVTKESFRQKVWNHLEDNDLAQFPRPVHNRIPNFKDSNIACDKAAALEIFQKAHTIKVNPDKPQEQARFLILEANKTLLVPTPRLRTGLFNKIIPPLDCGKEGLHTCASSQGVREHSEPIGLESKVHVDLVILGSVAVSSEGYRIGKGEGYADMEYAMMRCMGAVDENTIVVTTVHDSQVLDLPEDLFGEHDLTVDYIITPTQIIECPKKPKPPGIIWSMLDKEKLKRIPILKKLRNQERAEGKDVTLKDDGIVKSGEEDHENHASEDDKHDAKKKPRQRRRRGPRKESEEGEHLEDGDLKHDEEGEHGKSPRRNRRPRRNREKRASETKGESEGEHRESEGDHQEGDGDHRKPGKGRRIRRPRKSSEQAESDGQHRHSSEGEGEGKPHRERRQRKNSGRARNTPSIYVGSLPRSLRVSDFKAKIREKDVNPLRVIWHGGTGHAFLQFEEMPEAEKAIEALKGLQINERDLKIEMSNRSAGRGGDVDQHSSEGGHLVETHKETVEAED